MPWGHIFNVGSPPARGVSPSSPRREHRRSSSSATGVQIAPMTRGPRHDARQLTGLVSHRTFRDMALLASEHTCAEPDPARFDLLNRGQATGWALDDLRRKLTSPMGSNVRSDLDLTDDAEARAAYVKLAQFTQRQTLKTETLELPEINVFIASNLGGRGMAVHDGSGPCTISYGTRMQHHVNRTVGVWDERLVSVLPCLARKRVSDFPDKFAPVGLKGGCAACVCGWLSKSLTSQSRDEYVRQPGIHITLTESHGGNIWHYIRDLMFTTKLFDDIERFGLDLDIVGISTPPADWEPDPNRPNRSRIASSWQWSSLLAVVPARLHDRINVMPSPPLRKKGMNATVVPYPHFMMSKLTRSFSMTLHSGRTLKRAVWRSCGIDPDAGLPGPRTIKLVVRPSSRVLEDPGGSLMRLLHHASRELFDGRLVVANVTKRPGSFCDQVRAAAAAKVYIGFSGADLTNAFFLPYDSVLIELLPVSYMRDMAKALNTKGNPTVPLPTTERTDTTSVNDFSSYMSRIGQMYVAAYATLPVPSHDSKKTWAQCQVYTTYYYGSKQECVHHVDVRRMMLAFVRARALIVQHDALINPSLQAGLGATLDVPPSPPLPALRPPPPPSPASKGRHSKRVTTTSKWSSWFASHTAG